MAEPMISEVGWIGIGSKLCQTLDITYDPREGVDDATGLHIEQFCRNDKAKIDKRP
jgi:hypothetical protein